MSEKLNQQLEQQDLEAMADQLLAEDAAKREKEDSKSRKKLDDKTIAALPAATLITANEKLKDLLAKGCKTGKLDPGELSDVVDTMDLDGDQMDHIYDSLADLGIEVGSDEFLTDLPDDGEPPLEEIAEIEKACEVTADMHLAAMRTVRPGIRECEVAAAVAEAAYRHNYELSFPIIATINGQTLHNHDHSHLIKSGDMLLLDAGAETEMGYAGDMSSTIPADAKFTTRQREIYDIQVAAHEAAVAALKPGVPFVDVYELSCKVIMEGLKELGFVKGDPMEAVKAGAHAMFMPCGLGHMMGLDVHDMENLGEQYVGYDGQPKSTQFGRKSLRLGRKLEPGFVLTIEPGIYFIPELMDLWKSQNKFTEFINYDKLFTYKDFSGIRNEEDYLITADGARMLGKKVPVRAEDVEAYKAQNK